MLARRFYEEAPFTTGLTNPGASISGAEGLWLRGGALSLPSRLAHVGTLWGIAPIQPEVLPIDGQPTVRPGLPVVLLFDHRLVDGVRASKMLARFNAILQDPAAVFGAIGERSA